MSCFFHKKKKETDFSLLTSSIEPQSIMPTLEQFFGIINKKVKRASDGSAFALMRLTGFANIYVVTNDASSMSVGSRLNVKRLDELKEFLAADGFDAKRTLYLKHATQYIDFLLEKDGFNDDERAVFSVLTDTIKQQFVEKTQGLLNPRKTIINKRPVEKRYHNERKLTLKEIAEQNHRDNLSQFSSCVTSVILSSLAIKTALKKLKQGDVDGFKARLKEVRSVSFADSQLDSVVQSYQQYRQRSQPTISYV